MLVTVPVLPQPPLLLQLHTPVLLQPQLQSEPQPLHAQAEGVAVAPGAGTPPVDAAAVVCFLAPQPVPVALQPHTPVVLQPQSQPEPQSLHEQADEAAAECPATGAGMLVPAEAPFVQQVTAVFEQVHTPLVLQPQEQLSPQSLQVHFEASVGGLQHDPGAGAVTAAADAEEAAVEQQQPPLPSTPTAFADVEPPIDRASMRGAHAQVGPQWHTALVLLPPHPQSAAEGMLSAASVESMKRA